MSRDPAKRKASNDAYYARNVERIRERDRARYHREPWKIKNRITAKLQKDPIYRLKHTLRVRLNRAITINQKSGSAIRDLGCSIEDLKTYFELKFQPGMSWENQGQWHIDHIVPLSRFDLTDREQFLKACHYSNLQPLWAIDNLTKGNR